MSTLQAATASPAKDWELSALHTPGHAPDHLCFVLEGRRLVFSGDHVMAWNTSVVAPPEGRMADYLRSLELLLNRDDEMLLPGHGGRILEPRRTVKAYLLHRRWREQAILEAVRKGTNTVRKLLPVIYRDLDKEVVGAATPVAAGPHRASRRARPHSLRRRRKRRLRRCSSLTVGFGLRLVFRARGRHDRLQAHDDLLEDLPDAVRVAAEVVVPVA